MMISLKLKDSLNSYIYHYFNKLRPNYLKVPLKLLSINLLKLFQYYAITVNIYLSIQVVII